MKSTLSGRKSVKHNTILNYIKTRIPDCHDDLETKSQTETQYHHRVLLIKSLDCFSVEYSSAENIDKRSKIKLHHRTVMQVPGISVAPAALPSDSQETESAATRQRSCSLLEESPPVPPSNFQFSATKDLSQRISAHLPQNEHSRHPFSRPIANDQTLRTRSTLTRLFFGGTHKQNKSNEEIVRAGIYCTLRREQQNRGKWLITHSKLYWPSEQRSRWLSSMAHAYSATVSAGCWRRGDSNIYYGVWTDGALREPWTARLWISDHGFLESRYMRR